MERPSNPYLESLETLAQQRQWLELWNPLEDPASADAIVATLETAGDQYAHNDTEGALRCYHFAVRTAKSHSIAKASLDAKYSRVLVESYSIRGFEHGIAHEIIALAASGRVSEAEELLPMVRTFCESAERVEAAAAEMFATNRQAAEWVLQKLIERVFDVREAARLREKLEKLRSSPPPAPPSPVQAAFPASLKWIEDLAIAGSIAEARAELNASKKKAATTTTASRSRLPAKRWRTVSATNIQLPPAGSTRCPHRVSAICIVR